MQSPWRDTAALSEGAPAGLRIIVADDEEPVRLLVVRIVQRAYPGAEIIAAANGQSALEAYQQHGADAIITDQSMPIMDGLSLTHLLRARHATVPILLISGLPQNEQPARAAGVSGFLAKPFTPAQLLQLLALLLS